MSPEVVALLAVLCGPPFTCQDSTVQNARTYTFFRLHDGRRFEFCWVDRRDASRWSCRNIEHGGRKQ